MLRWIDPIETAPQHSRRWASRLQTSPMGRRIDASCEATHHNDTALSELGRNSGTNLESVRRRGARANHCDRRLGERLEIALGPQNRWRVVDAGEKGRIPLIEQRDRDDSSAFADLQGGGRGR